MSKKHRYRLRSILNKNQLCPQALACQFPFIILSLLFWKWLACRKGLRLFLAYIEKTKLHFFVWKRAFSRNRIVTSSFPGKAVSALFSRITAPTRSVWCLFRRKGELWKNQTFRREALTENSDKLSTSVPWCAVSRSVVSTDTTLPHSNPLQIFKRM